MNDTPEQNTDRPPAGNLTDFVNGVDEKNPLDLEVGIREDGSVVVFHDKPFKTALSWFEYDVETSKLDFIFDDGEMRDIGLPLAPSIGKHMQNSHQILTIWMDDKTGDAKQGDFIPLIIHGK